MNRLLLVHGAFHGAWCWDRLRPELKRRGVVHDAVELPFTSADADVAEVRRGIDRIGADGHDVTVLGHSFGGAVISAAATLDGEPYGAARSLVYLTAVMTAGRARDAVGAGSGMNAIHHIGDTAFVVPELARDAFFHRCSTDDAEWAADRIRAMPSARLAAAPAPIPAWRVLPSTYVVCTDDRIITPSEQRRMAREAGSVHDIDSDHSPFLSCPSALADLLKATIMDSSS